MIERACNGEEPRVVGTILHRSDFEQVRPQEEDKRVLSEAYQKVFEARASLQNFKSNFGMGNVKKTLGKLTEAFIDLKDLYKEKIKEDVKKNIKIFLELEDAVDKMRKPNSEITPADVWRIVQEFRPDEEHPKVKALRELQKEHYNDIAIRNAKLDYIDGLSGKALEEYIEDYKKKLSEKPKQLHKVDEPVVIYQKLQFFKDILKDGRIKSQFETGISGGNYDPEWRARKEEVCFGYPTYLPAALRPIYGTTGSPSRTILTTTYAGMGGVAIVLKPEVRDRATRLLGNPDVCGTDVLYGRPVPYNSPDIDYFPLRKKVPQGLGRDTFEKNDRDPLEIQNIPDDILGQEVEIHGGVAVNDIKEVVFLQPIHHYAFYDYKGLEELKKKLQAINMKVTFLKEEDDQKESEPRKYNFQVQGSKIEGAFKKERFLPKDLIDGLKQQPFLKNLDERKVGVWEGYTLERHTKMVMYQFERYFAKGFISLLLKKDEFRLMLALHDIGKPLAVQETGNTLDQHTYTGQIVPEILKQLNIPEKETNIIVSLATHDFIGGYMQGFKSFEDTAKQISDEAKHLDIPIQDYFQLFKSIICAMRDPTRRMLKDKKLWIIFLYSITKRGR